MCGIVGLWDPKGEQSFNATCLKNMNHSQAHRGPDDEGYFLAEGVALAHRRLSIIDLDTGRQPVFNEDGQIVVVFNGEIYNFHEIKSILVKAGHQFQTHTDTEVIVHAYEEWGVSCLDHFRGMFAFLLYDKAKQLLFVARDRVGVKPLYYTIFPDETLGFSSELKAFYQHPHFKMILREDAIMDYFAYGYVPDPKTIYTQAFKLPPGHYLLLKKGEKNVQPRMYWDVSFEVQPQSEKTAVEVLSAYLKESIKLRMVSDVPVGAFLSGGVDSSAVVAMMAEQSMQPIKTCSIKFDIASFDESSYAAEVAKQFKTEHHSYLVDLNDFSLLDKMHQIYDEPFADSSALPTYRVCEAARKMVKVVLSGDGADEHFAGYRRYKGYFAEEQLKQYLPLSLRRPLFSFLQTVYPQFAFYPRFLRAKSTFKSLSMDPLEGYFHTISICKNIQQLFNRNFIDHLSGYHPISVLEKYAENAAVDHPLSFAQYLDIKTYLAGDILTKVDRASMHHSLELREPMLDHKMIEWAAQLPPDLKLNHLTSKYILKKSLERKLSNRILYRKKKGFSVPLNHWFRGTLQQRILGLSSSPILEQLNIFNLNNINKIIKQHLAGNYDHSALIWTLLVFENFIEHHHGLVERNHKYANTACA